jgi:hypothetical protein
MRHPTRLLNQPTIGDPKSTDSVLSAQGTNDKLYLARALRRGLEHDRHLERHLCVSLEPLRHHKGPGPPVARSRLAQGARGTLRQDREPWGAPTTVLAPST